MSAGDLIKKMKPFIYKSLDMAQLATRAKDAGYIKSYYDVVEALFEPNELLEIINFIIEINNITGEDVKGDIEEIKK
jgi:hypothetical protein